MSLPAEPIEAVQQRAALDLAEGPTECGKCGRVTHWRRPKRGAALLECSVCKSRVPCRNADCGHLDCSDARRIIAHEREGQATA